MRLSEQLAAQQREHLAREIDFFKKGKSKNLLKRGFKKLKGKIQVGQVGVRLQSFLLLKILNCKCTSVYKTGFFWGRG